MPKARSREERVYRAISLAQYFSEGGHTIDDAAEEFKVNGTTIKRDMDYLKECILCRNFSDNPQKEHQLIAWYNKAKRNLRNNIGNRSRH